MLQYLEEDYTVLSQRQNDRFIHLFRYASKQSPFYQKLYAEHGVDINAIKSVNDIQLLPIITKDDIKDDIDEIVIGNRLLKAKGYTSGTTGSPLMVYRNYNSILEEGAYIWAQRARQGHWPGMKTVSMRGDLGRNELDRFDLASNVLYLSSYNLNEQNAEYYYKKIAKFSPNALLAYPSSAEILATLLDNINQSVHIPYVFTSSETLYDFQREKIHRVLGSSIQDWYGNAERTIALMQNQESGYDELPLYSVNEYKKNGTITTGLINSSFPLIRYQINDIILPDTSRSSYNERITIRKIIGRDDDVLNLPDGTRVGRLDVVFKGVDNIQFAQFEQNDPHSFDLNIVVNNRFNESDEKFLVTKLRDRVGKEIQFNVNRVDKNQIKLTQSGKYKLVLNHTKDQNQRRNLEHV
ncbi:MAG: hypothetical protein RIG62_18990 [Cyclobacteriaceae bacterium]